jgi:hypothetical protein
VVWFNKDRCWGNDVILFPSSCHVCRLQVHRLVGGAVSHTVLGTVAGKSFWLASLLLLQCFIA